MRNWINSGLFTFILTVSLGSASADSSALACRDSNCSGPIKVCKPIEKDNNFRCPADYSIGEHVCDQFADCKMVKGECKTVTKAGAEHCLGCYKTCFPTEKIPFNKNMDSFKSCFESCLKVSKSK